MLTTKKVVLGQFNTKTEHWLCPQVIDFILSSKCCIAYDPFAGAGDLLNAVKRFNFREYVGLDIDANLGWKENDSLIFIPHVDDAIIITNPPYISNYSAARKKIIHNVEHYFMNSQYDDVYLIALDRMLEAQKNVVAIVPETFLNSCYKQKDMLSSITVIEDNPFNDTENPVCVLCFDGRRKAFSEISIYKGDNLVSNLKVLESQKLYPTNKLDIKFNTLDGWLALRAVDSTNPKDMIRFDYKENIKYNWAKGIKVSSRLLTLIKVNIPLEKRDRFIKYANEKIESHRNMTCDLTLSPFKGNMTNGRRRRRLDYRTARAILELAYIEMEREINENKS
jgi:hypothetical protein